MACPALSRPLLLRSCPSAFKHSRAFFSLIAPSHDHVHFLPRRSSGRQRRWVSMPVGPQLPGPPDEEPESEQFKKKNKNKKDPKQQQQDEGTSSEEKFRFGPTAFKMLESALTTLASVSILGLVGYSYTRYYKYMVLEKMENAFSPGDPILDLADSAKRDPISSMQPDDGTKRDHWVLREEQELIDRIVNGTLKGQYHLLVGEKGTGKSSMLIEAMAKIDGEGVAMFDAHADPEIFRIRLGKALDFEYHEDNIGSLFSIRGPREASALLDVERAFNKLEKIALRRREKVGRPLIIIVNSMHLVRNDEEGRDLVELLQQRAEQWAASNLATFVFNSDDYWIYERLKQYATRMNVIKILDLTRSKAVEALHNYRQRFHSETPSREVLESVYELVGGRLSYLGRVAKSPDMLAKAREICETEKTWFLTQCGILGEEMDDDVMDQQKFASAAMVLAKALVELEAEMESTWDPEHGHVLPELPLHRARWVMTRADFIQEYDARNLFTIDSHAMVRADSVPMMNAFREICTQPGFDEFLQATLDRISAIESLGRTRELTIKDLWDGGKYEVSMRDARGRGSGGLVFRVAEKEDGDGDEKKGDN